MGLNPKLRVGTYKRGAQFGWNVTQRPRHRERGVEGIVVE